MASSDESVGGDGLVVVQVAEDTPLFDPTAVYMELTGDNTFSSIARAGIIAHGSHLRMATPDVMDAGYMGDYGSSIFSQSSGVVDMISEYEDSGASDEGGDDGAEPPPVEECDDDDSLDLDSSGFDFGSPTG